MKQIVKRIIKWIIWGIPETKIAVSVSQINHQNSLENKRIVITGGNKGLGFHIAKKCVALGAKVVIVGRNVNKLKEASCQLKNCHYIVYDISILDKYDILLKEATALLGGPIEFLVNNAGISLHEGSFKNVTVESFDTQLNINLKAPYFLSKEFLIQAEKNNITNGGIIFITSERGLYADDIPYGLIKAGINSLTKGLARRELSKGIRVNSVAPGVTATDMTGYKKDDNLYRPQACGKRVFLPEEVAETVCFLLSDAAKCISGEIIACNQGNHLRCDW